MKKFKITYTYKEIGKYSVIIAASNMRAAEDKFYSKYANCKIITITEV